MGKHFDHILEARSFLTEKLSSVARLSREGRTLRQDLYILQYDPRQEKSAEELLQAMCATDFPTRGIRPLIANLYDIVLDYLDREEMWTPLCEVENEVSREDIITMLHDSVGVREVIVPCIEELAEASPDFDILFITGVGETYPFIRTHSVLAELNISKPVVLVFPGSFVQRSDGSTSLDILNIDQGGSGGYYRATNVFDL